MTSIFTNPSNLSKKQPQKNNPSLAQPTEQKSIVEELIEINLLRQNMLKDTKNFDNELDELEKKLVKKANELEILTSKEMEEISHNNLAFVREFVNYQESLIKKLQQKNSNWDKFQMDLSDAEAKLNDIMDKNELVPKLALIEILEEEVEKLIDEINELKKQKERRRV